MISNTAAFVNTICEILLVSWCLTHMVWEAIDRDKVWFFVWSVATIVNVIFLFRHASQVVI